MVNPSDVTLIRRVQEGQTDAFDRLVRRHQSWIYGFALRVTRNDDEAEDLGQEICIECFRSLSGLREAAKFKGWLATIARRVAYRWQRGRRQVQSFDEMHHTSTSIDPWDRDISIDIRERIETALRALSDLNRRITMLHYLDGYGIEEITKRLDIPTGTVKRRLHEARAQMKEEMIMRDAPQKSRHGIRPIHFTISGNTTDSTERLNPLGLTRPLLAGQILRSIRHEAKSTDDIAREVGAAVPYVEDHLTGLAEGELTIEEKPGRYLAGCTVVLESEWRDIRKQTRKIGKRDADIIAGELPRIREVFEGSGMAKQGFDWDRLQWVALTIFLLEIGIMRNRGGLALVLPDAPLRPDGGRWHITGIEGGAVHKWTIFCSFTGSKERGYVDIHLEGFKKGYTTNVFHPEGMDIMSALSSDPMPVEQIAERLSLGLQAVKNRIVAMSEHGYLINEDGLIKLNFPILNATDDRKIAPVIDEVSRRIVEESRKPGLEALEQAYEDMGTLPPDHNYHHLNFLASSSMDSYCCEYLVKSGILNPPPRSALGDWAFCGWIEPCRSIKM